MGKSLVNKTALIEGEPILMPLQTDPFNGDTFVCDEFLKLKERFNIDTVIEGGSCVGGSAKWLAENFKKVYTIEINPIFRDYCLKRIEGLTNIESILGSTVDVLGRLLQDSGNSCIIFLDSHWQLYFPLLDELMIIKESGLKPVIIVHDCKVPDQPILGYDSYKGVEISYETMKPYLDSIYGQDGYSYHYNSDAESTEIKRGVIYIYPN